MSSCLPRPALACMAAIFAAGCATSDPGAPRAQGKSPAAASVQAQSAANFHPAAIEVVAAQFGVFGADQAGRRMLYETDKFPGVVAAPFGWFIVFKTDKRPSCGARSSSCRPRPPPGVPARQWASSR